MPQDRSGEDTIATAAEPQGLQTAEPTLSTGPQDHQKCELLREKPTPCSCSSFFSLSLLFLCLVPNVGRLCLVSVTWVTCLSPSCKGVWEMKHLTSSVSAKGGHVPRWDSGRGKVPKVRGVPDAMEQKSRDKQSAELSLGREGRRAKK